MTACGWLAYQENSPLGLFRGLALGNGVINPWALTCFKKRPGLLKSPSFATTYLLVSRELCGRNVARLDFFI